MEPVSEREQVLHRQGLPACWVLRSQGRLLLSSWDMWLAHAAELQTPSVEASCHDLA
jgi:hypothetical protein